MYCINCGVKLGDTEQVCPLCGTDPLNPNMERKHIRPLYPENRYPGIRPRIGAVNGTILALFLLPLLITFLVDWRVDGKLNWFGFAAGGLLVAYAVFALPIWFRDPNPVIFVPCDFAAAALYLLYIDLITGGGWFLSFAFPVTCVFALIVTSVIALRRYLRKGSLYIFGGAFMALGGTMLLIEYLLDITFGRAFVGWSIYPLAVLILLGGLLIYLAIDRSAREVMERKLFI